LKSLGGRWDALIKGWLFPFDGKEKLMRGLETSGEATSLEVTDRAKVKLVLGDSDKGLLVTGETFPVKELIKNQGGVWNATLRGWTLRCVSRDALKRLLKSCPDVGVVEDDASGRDDSIPKRPAGGAVVVWEPVHAPDTTPPTRRTTPVVDSPGRAVKSAKVIVGAAPLTRDGSSPPGLGNSVALREKQGALLLKKPAGAQDHKVVEIGKRLSKAERRADGSRADIETEKRERKTSCKHTGAHVNTESVTKRRKVVETKDKVVETKTIVVKRVRSKT